MAMRLTWQCFAILDASLGGPRPAVFDIPANPREVPPNQPTGTSRKLITKRNRNLGLRKQAWKAAQNLGLGLRRRFNNRAAVPSRACLENPKEGNSSRLALILHFIFHRNFRSAAVVVRCASLRIRVCW